MVGPQFGAGWLFNRRGRNNLATAIDPAGELVHQGLGEIGNHGEPPAHVAVERAVANGQLALIPGGQKQAAEFIGERHHGDPSQAGLKILLGGVLGAPIKGFGKPLIHHTKGTCNGQFEAGDAKGISKHLGILDTPFRRIGAGHRHSGDMLSAEGLHSQNGGKRRVDPAAQSQDSTLESTFAEVIPQSEHQGLVKFLKIVARDTRTGCLRHVEHRELFVKTSEFPTACSCTGDRNGVPVEDQLVVSPNGIAIVNRHAKSPCLSIKHLQTCCGFAELEGGGTQVQQEIRTCGNQLGGWIDPVERPGQVFGSPEILTDRDADRVVAVYHRGGGSSRLKIARFVEDVVGGKESLVDDHRRPAPLQKGGGIVKRFALAARVPVDEADNEWHLSDRGVDCRQRFKISLHEFPRKNQVKRRVSGNRKFGREHQFGSLGDQRTVGGKDRRRVPVKITDRRVDLGKADLHGWDPTRIPTAVWHKCRGRVQDWPRHGR